MKGPWWRCSVCGTANYEEDLVSGPWQWSGCTYTNEYPRKFCEPIADAFVLSDGHTVWCSRIGDVESCTAQEVHR